ncbi:MAG: hypothetical protein A2X49_02200 [Lentisphaerae bacterium GWF2_52_8]|nr:MAG: hypothetical protein A2X49_02200 [Lentisphaerae bacterium GWF2_52_8]
MAIPSRFRKSVFYFTMILMGFILIIVSLETFLQIRAWFLYRIQHKSFINQVSCYVPSQDPELLYEPRKNHVVNNIKVMQKDGGRFSDLITEDKSPDEYRIVILGDSIASQWAYPDQSNFGNHLLKTIHLEKTKKACLLNWSIHGYCTSQEYEMFSTVICKYKPDLLILEFCSNDLAPCGHPNEFLTSGFHFRIRLFNFLTYYFTPTMHVYKNQFLNRYTEDNCRKMFDAFISLKELCDKNGTHLVIACFPFFNDNIYQDEKSFPEFHKFRKRLMQFWAENGFLIIDLYKEFKKNLVVMDSLRLDKKDFIHANQEGHRQIGDILGQKINELLLKQNPM